MAQLDNLAMPPSPLAFDLGAERAALKENVRRHGEVVGRVAAVDFKPHHAAVEANPDGLIHQDNKIIHATSLRDSGPSRWISRPSSGGVNPSGKLTA